MYCMSCQTELPDEASFCWKCGTPQKALVKVEPIFPPAIVQKRPSQGVNQEIIIDVAGEAVVLEENFGLLVLYGSQEHREWIINVKAYESYRHEGDWQSFYPERRFRIKERRVGGFAVYVGVADLLPTVYSINLPGKSSWKQVMIEAGEVTEIHL